MTAGNRGENDMSDELTDAEYAEMQRNHEALKKAYAKDPEGTLQAMKDAVQFPRKSGDVK
jgi:hypothetical protein